MASCDCVSYLGLGLGGGHGRFQGLHGLVADNLLSATVLLSSGKIITASSTSYPDLFWALRGAGHNFGLVLEAKFRIYDPLDGDYWLNAEYFYDTTHEKITEVFNHLEKFRSYQPAELSIWTYFGAFDPTAPGILNIRVSIQYGGKDLDKFKPYGKEFLALKPVLTKEDILPLTKIADVLVMGQNVPEFCTTPGPKRRLYSVMLKEFDKGNVVEMFKFMKRIIEEKPHLAGSLMIYESYAMQGVKKARTETTAYPHRDVNILT